MYKRLLHEGPPDFNVKDFKTSAERAKEHGIAGIEYKDAKSRGLLESGGTNNYVVFDDKLIEILRKYGLAGLMAGGAATQSPGLLAPRAQSPNN